MRVRRILVVAGLVVAAMLALGSAHLLWKRKLPTRGGLYFFQPVEIAAPQFRQGDERWRSDHLGATDGTLGAEGCAVASAAMVLGSYGIETNPQRLNNFLTANGGYTEQGWLYWEKAAEFLPGRIEKAYEDLPSFWLIDSNLLRRNPCIVRIRFPSGTTHFVVIVGKRGFDYLIRDPGAGASRGVYPLRELAREIEALRFYRPVSRS
ncbi:MAG: hypothetical protein QOD99_1086 [Chthoniobacter sp.]|jgi:hypothetical protein|nr:hypothetical protein [Chthoniobacter sp.]